MSYFRENYNEISKMVNQFVDSNPTKYNLINDEMLSEFKTEVLWDYTEFLYAISYLNLDISSKLYNHWKYSEQINNVCKQTNGNISTLDSNIIDKFLDKLRDNIKDWYKNKLNLELKEAERKHYTTTAFDYKNDVNPSEQYGNRLNQLKQAASRNMTNKFNY